MLDTYALTTVDAVKGYLGSLPSRDGLWIYCSQADATAATVEVTPTTIVLIITGGGQAGTTTLTFSDAGKDTLAELIVAINAVTGWKSGAIYDGDADSTDLVITGATACLGSANELTLKVEDNYLIERLIDRATYFIERYCHRKFMSRAYTREIYYGSGHPNLILEQYPVTTVSRISMGRTNALYIKNTTATNHATIEITASALKYSADGAAATSLTLSTAPNTINGLIAAINLIAGWSATLLDSSLGTRKATDLLIRPGMYCLSPSLAYCEIPDDELTDYQLISPSEDRNYGMLYCPGGWIRGIEYFVDYTAGYATAPIDMEDICIRLVVNRYNQSKKDGSIKSESLGDYSYTMADVRSLPDDLKDAADLYRRFVL
jgi:hypothetical protein